MPRMSGVPTMYFHPSTYSLHGRTTSFSLKTTRSTRNEPAVSRSPEAHHAEITKESEFKTKAHSYPNLLTVMPPSAAPIVNVIQAVI